MTDVKPLRAGVVGAGTGGMLSIKALEASERFELVGVADLSEAARPASWRKALQLKCSPTPPAYSTGHGLM